MSNSLFDQSLVEAEIDALVHDEDITSFFEHYKILCLRICDAMYQARAGSRTSHAIQQVVEYVKEQYMNPDINMYFAAERFGFAPSYMSRAIKEHTGETFSSFLRSVHINVACELLQDFDNIEEVARKVGYYNSNSFRVSFKNTLGITPSQYRYESRLGELKREKSLTDD